MGVRGALRNTGTMRAGSARSYSGAVLDPEPTPPSVEAAAQLPAPMLQMPPLDSIGAVLDGLAALPAILEGATPKERRELAARYAEAIRSSRRASFDDLVAPNQTLHTAHGFYRRIQDLKALIEPLEREKVKLERPGGVKQGCGDEWNRLYRQIRTHELEKAGIIYRIQFTEVRVPYERMKVLLEDYDRATDILSKAIGDEIRGFARPGNLDRATAILRETTERVAAQVKIRTKTPGLPAQKFSDEPDVYLDEL